MAASPPPHASPADDTRVVVWRTRLDVPPDDLARAERLLSSDERTRAERYRFPIHRARYIAARGALRAILAEILETDPAGLRFVYGPQGKPTLATPSGGGTVCFNVSHAGDTALIAVTERRRIGVDLEQARPDLAYLEIAERFFSPREVATLRALTPQQQQEGFLRCWTRKEAYIKALGVGLSLNLASFDVSLAPGDAPALLASRPDPHEASRWSLHDLDGGPGYTAALAVEGHDLHVTQRRWTPTV